MSVTVRVSYDKLQDYIRLFPERIEGILEQWKQEGSEETMNYMRGIVPVKTGFLRESITRRFTPKGFTVYPTASYAKFVEEDTAPHTIFPRRASVLRWYGSHGQPIFAMKVQHPGTKGQHFMRRTKEAMRTVLKQLLQIILREKL